MSRDLNKTSMKDLFLSTHLLACAVIVLWALSSNLPTNGPALCAAGIDDVPAIDTTDSRPGNSALCDRQLNDAVADKPDFCTLISPESRLQEI
jgi:hypothetical protein